MTHTTSQLERLAREFDHFAHLCNGESPLYAALSAAAARDDDVLALAGHAQKRQPAVNMLFAAVHYLLLGGASHELQSFYPSVGGQGNAHDAWPAFRLFCTQFRQPVIELVASRRVQTNVVGRCGPLLPAFAIAHRQFNHPVHLIEVGASAGFNLNCDRFRYEYSDGRTCGTDSPVIIRTQLHGELAPPFVEIPPVAERIGIDITPADVRDDSAMRWIEALIWPDQLDRIAQHRAARTIALQYPPVMRSGDAMECLPDVVAHVSSEHLPCIYHSHAIYQMSKERRADFNALIASLGTQRDLAHVALEWLGDAPGPQLRLRTFRGGRMQSAYLADAHHHGRWLRWLVTDTA